MARYDYESQFDFVRQQFDEAQERGEKEVSVWLVKLLKLNL